MFSPRIEETKLGHRAHNVGQIWGLCVQTPFVVLLNRIAYPVPFPNDKTSGNHQV